MTAPAARSRRTTAATRLLALASVMLGALALAPSAWAAPPSNDNLQSPFNVDLAGGAITVNNSEATYQDSNTYPPGEPLTPGGTGTCSGRTMIATTWYRILGNGGTISVNTAGSNFDTVLAVYLAPTPALNDGLPCNDDASSSTLTSAVSFPSEVGRAYLIQVGGCNACGGALGPTGNMVMHVSATDPPPVTPPPPPPPPPPVVITPPPPPDADGDGIPENGADKCPGAKATRDINKDGCQDKPKRILSDLHYEFRYLRSGGRIQGIQLSRVQLTRAPKGGRVSVRCAGCSTRRGRSYSFTARRSGTQSMGPLNGLQLRRGARLTVVVTAAEHLGRRIIVTMGSRRDVVKLSCLAVGSTSARVPCSSGS